MLPSAAQTTASSLSAVMTAPSTASGMPASGAVTRNFSASSVAIMPVRCASRPGLPTRGRSAGIRAHEREERRRRPPSSGSRVVHVRAVARVARARRETPAPGGVAQRHVARRERVVALARAALTRRGAGARPPPRAARRARPRASARCALKCRAAARVGARVRRRAAGCARGSCPRRRSRRPSARRRRRTAAARDSASRPARTPSAAASSRRSSSMIAHAKAAGSRPSSRTDRSR